MNRGSNPRGAASNKATCPSGQGAVCKTVYTGSIPVVASIASEHEIGPEPLVRSWRASVDAPPVGCRLGSEWGSSQRLGTRPGVRAPGFLYALRPGKPRVEVEATRFRAHDLSRQRGPEAGCETRYVSTFLRSRARDGLGNRRVGHGLRLCAGNHFAESCRGDDLSSGGGGARRPHAEHAHDPWVWPSVHEPDARLGPTSVGRARWRAPADGYRAEATPTTSSAVGSRGCSGQALPSLGGEQASGLLEVGGKPEQRRARAKRRANGVRTDMSPGSAQRSPSRPSSLRRGTWLSVALTARYRGARWRSFGTARLPPTRGWIR